MLRTHARGATRKRVAGNPYVLLQGKQHKQRSALRVRRDTSSSRACVVDRVVATARRGRRPSGIISPCNATQGTDTNWEKNPELAQRRVIPAGSAHAELAQTQTKATLTLTSIPSFLSRLLFPSHHYKSDLYYNLPKSAYYSCS